MDDVIKGNPIIYEEQGDGHYGGNAKQYTDRNKNNNRKHDKTKYSGSKKQSGREKSKDMGNIMADALKGIIVGNREDENK